jgi:predicted unusual protein kinase regulating ubiquinone biosynthesis (AarF/ABC1/UbiB family)
MGLRDWIFATVRIVAEYLTGGLKYDDCLPKLLTQMIQHNVLLIKVFQSLSSNQSISPQIRGLFQKQTDNAIHTDDDVDYKLLARITSEYKICLDSPKPIKAGMIAVVFKGTLANGEKVAIKMKRRHIYERVAAGHRDFVGIYNKLQIISRPFKRYYDILSNLQSFVDTGDYVLSQCVFDDEIATMKQMRDDCRDTPKFIIPKVLNNKETDNEFIVMDFLEGIDCFSVIEEDKLMYGTEFFRFIWHTLYLTKYSHTDLHPGNMICMSDGRIGIIDFGMKQEMNIKLRTLLIALSSSGVERGKYPDKKIDVLSKFSDALEPRLIVETLTTTQYENINEMLINLYCELYKGDLDESKFNNALIILRTITGIKHIRVNMDLFRMLMSLSMCQATARLFMPNEDDLKRIMKNTLREAME